MIQFGANLPFLHYGDVGPNAWGWRGFSTEGFIPSRGFYDVKRVLSNPVSGPALVLSTDIVALNGVNVRITDSSEACMKEAPLRIGGTD